MRNIKLSQTIKSASALMFGHIFSAVVGIICSIIQARFVSPGQLGQLQSYAIITGYLTFLHLGTFTALQRELPYYIGKGDKEKSGELVSVCQLWALIASTFCMCGFLVVATIAFINKDYMAMAGWLVQISSIFVFLYTGFLTTTFRTSSEFVTLAKSDTINAITMLLSLPLLMLHPYYGLCGRTSAPPIVSGIFLHIKRPFKVKPSWNFAVLKSLIAFGLPLSIFGYLETSCWLATQNYIVLHNLGARSLGLLSFAMSAHFAMLVAPQAINQIYMPKIAEQLGKTGKLNDAIGLCIRPTIISFFIMVLASTAVWFLVEPIVKLIVPKFIDAVPAIRWAILMLPITAMRLPHYLLIASKNTLAYASTVIIGLIVGIIFLFLAVKSGSNELPSVVLAYVIGKLVMILISYGIIILLVRQERQNSNSV